MKKITKYQCDYCHTKYSDPESCKKCEEGHNKDAKIKELYFGASGKYPATINVEFEDKRVITYRRLSDDDEE